MAADAGGDDGGALAGGFTGNETGCCLSTVIIEVADGLVGQQEAEGLTERAYDGDALLLPERQQAHGGVAFLGDVEFGEPCRNGLAIDMMGETVLYLDVLYCRKLRKQSQVLIDTTDHTTTDVEPLGTRKTTHVGLVEQDGARIVIATARYIAAQRAFATAAVGLDKVTFTSLEANLLLPHGRLARRVGTEHLGQDTRKRYYFHWL